jgi:hypothetical protein
LDEFVARFSSLPRVKRVLAPLWQSPFTEEPKLWSVIAHCRIASRLHDIGRPVYGFEVPPGSGNKTADIHCEINSHEAFVDIEMWHELWGETAETIRGAAKKRCETKAQKKFLDLKENAIGVVVQVAFADDMSAILNSQDVLTSFELEAPSRCAGQLMLIAANGKDGRGTSYRVLFDGENW